MGARGPRTKYPAYLTLSCACGCGKTVKVFVKTWRDRQSRYFATPACKKDYFHRVHLAQWEVRKTGKTSFVPTKSEIVEWQKPKEPCATVKPSGGREAEYWAALRRSKGIEVTV